MKRAPGDDIRGVGPYHSRVYPASEADMDRLHQQHGEQAPWHGEVPADDEGDQFAPVVQFLFALVHLGSRRREIFFARLQGMTWPEIGGALLKGATPQAAQKEFAAALKQFPALARAFPETKPKPGETT